jgi:NAD-dependent dihydropyrimidine dehydrogenase PreA subunit
VKRRIVAIDRDLCDGCGDCVPSCHEGAIRIVDGKAVLADDRLCDGLGDCLGECPRDAITIVEREAEDYDEALVRAQKSAAQVPVHAGCPGSAARPLAGSPAGASTPPRSPGARLGHWPVQLRLLHPAAPFLAGSDLLLCADCVPFAYPDFHRHFLDGRCVAVSCPKLDAADEGVERLAAIFAQARPRRVVVARMTVPCCGGLVRMAELARERANVDLPIEVEVITPDGVRLPA